MDQHSSVAATRPCPTTTSGHGLTSGQHAPIYEKLRPYSDFPSQIDGPTLWKQADFLKVLLRLSYTLTNEEILELNNAADDFISSGSTLQSITKAQFRLHVLEPRLAAIRDELLNGKGFFLLHGLPVQIWDRAKLCVVYLGLGCHIGNPICQNSRGHIVGHVTDVGEDSSQTDRVRLYRTHSRIPFHTDYCDIVGLLPLHHVEDGGIDELVSTHLIWNMLQNDFPEVAEMMTKPIWYFDRKNEFSHGENEWTRQPIFYMETSSPSRVYCKLDPSFVTSLKRFSDKQLVPPLTSEQVRALDIFETLCKTLCSQIRVNVGDIQWTSNSHIVHSRTEYKDPCPPAPRRHLLRLWLSTPEDEGGWALPMPDASHPRRGGVQVDYTPAKVPLHAE